MSLNWKSRYASMHSHGDAIFAPAGLHYILQLSRQASRDRGGRTVTPAELTTEFRRRIRTDFGKLAATVLEAWELRSPETFGKAVLLLGHYGCLQLDAADTASAFAGENDLLSGL